MVVLRSFRRRARALKRCRRALSGQTGLRLDAAADALVRCELATLDGRCADLKRKSGLEDVADSSDSEASQNGVVERRRRRRRPPSRRRRPQREEDRRRPPRRARRWPGASRSSSRRSRRPSRRRTTSGPTSSTRRRTGCARSWTRFSNDT